MINYIDEYHSKVENGEIVVCEKMKLQIKRVKILQEKYDFKHKNVDKKIKIIENFFYIKPNEQIKLSLVQKYILSVLYGFYDKDRKRVCRELVFMVARKNGKSGFAAVLGLLELITGEYKCQIYSAATKLDQAKIVYEEVYKLVQNNPEIGELINKRRTDMECKENSGILKPLANDSKTLDGLNISVSIIDELHEHKDLRLVDVMVSSQGLQINPLNIFITTNGHLRDCALDKKYEFWHKVLLNEIEDDSVQPFIFEQDDINEIEDESTWEKSNPHINFFPTLKENLRKSYLKMIDDPNLKTETLTKLFNIPQNPINIFFEPNECKSPKFNEELFKNNKIPFFVGVDHAYTRSKDADLTAVAFGMFNPLNDDVFKITYFLIPEFFKDNNNNLKNSISEKSKYDGIDYQYFIEKGDMVVIKGVNQITSKDVQEFIFNKYAEFGNPNWKKAGIDPSNLSELKGFINTLVKDDKFVVDVRNQQRIFNTPRIELMKTLRVENKIYENNELLEIQLANTVSKIDSNGYLLLDTLQRSKRNDGVIAELCLITAIDMYFNTNKTKGVQNKTYYQKLFNQAKMQEYFDKYKGDYAG